MYLLVGVCLGSRKIDFDCRAVVRLAINPDVATRLPHKTVDLTQPRPVPLPTSFVVKNGSNTRSTVALSIPVPVSVTATKTYWPEGTGSASAAIYSSSNQVLPVSIVSRPPPGIASRALTARLRIACSSSEASAKALHRPALPTISSRICSPNVLLSNSVIPASKRSTSIDFGSSGWRRENASNRAVSVAAR